jgi:hypothetical protein
LFQRILKVGAPSSEGFEFLVIFTALAIRQ